MDGPGGLVLTLIFDASSVLPACYSIAFASELKWFDKRQLRETCDKTATSCVDRVRAVPEAGQTGIVVGDLQERCWHVFTAVVGIDALRRWRPRPFAAKRPQQISPGQANASNASVGAALGSV